jgi:hypothetical protein
MIQTLPPDRTDQSLHVRILPGTSRSRDDFFNANCPDPLSEVLPINAITIAKKVALSAIPGESLQKLLCRPLRCGMGGYVEVQYAPAIVSEDEEYEQDLKADRGNHQEIDRD